MEMAVQMPALKKIGESVGVNLEENPSPAGKKDKT